MKIMFNNFDKKFKQLILLGVAFGSSMAPVNFSKAMNASIDRLNRTGKYLKQKDVQLYCPIGFHHRTNIPLFDSLIFNNMDKFEGLLKSSKNNPVKIREEIRDSYGNTLTHVAAEFGKKEVFLRLVNEFKGAIAVNNIFMQTPLHKVMGNLAIDFDVRNDMAIYIANRAPHLIFLKDKFGNDSINLAFENLNYNYINFCLKNADRLGIDFNKYRSRSGYGILSLYEESYVGEVDRISPIIKNFEQDLNAKDKYGNTLLHNFVTRSDIAEVSKLLENPKIDPNIKNKFGNSPFMEAVTGQELWQGLSETQFEIVGIFLKRPDVNVNLEDDNGDSPLHWASHLTFRLNVIKLLFRERKNDINVNLQNKKGQTPLHIAAAKYDGDYIVECLIENGADPFIEDNDGKTPISLATKELQEKMLMFINKK